MTLFVFNEYSTTMTEATSIDWYRTLKSNIIIILAFIIVWSSVIVVVPLKARTHSTIKITRKTLVSVSKRLSGKFNLSAVMPDNDDFATSSSEQIVRDYVTKYLPIIYRDDVSVLSRVVTQLSNKHRFYNFVANDDSNKAITTKYLEAFKILTHISVLQLYLIIHYLY